MKVALQDEIIIIKVDLDNTDYGYQKEKIKWQAFYARLIDMYYIRYQLIIASNKHEIKMLPFRDKAGNIRQKVIIKLDVSSKDEHEFKSESHKWSMYYSKEFGGKEMKYHMLFIPSDHYFQTENIEYFNTNILT